MDIEKTVEFLLDEHAGFEARLADLQHAADTNIYSVEKLTQLVDYLFTREVGSQKTRQQLQEDVAYLLRAQEQTDNRINALLAQHEQMKALLTEIKLKLEQE